MAGAAKRRRQHQVPTIYHHTSTLRTNLIWMSGVIEVEGKSGAVIHPHLGEIRTDPKIRRAMKDFPAVAWFTTRIEVPEVLKVVGIVDADTGDEKTRMEAEMANAYTLNRIALGFPIANVPVVPWPDYFGYWTAEGQELNESAREYGDNPDDWYISETAVDVLQASEVWLSKSILKPKLSPSEIYLRDVHRMVRKCRETPGVYILPSWLKTEQAEKVAQALRTPVWRPR
jgi:hypothetical protein